MSAFIVSNFEIEYLISAMKSLASRNEPRALVYGSVFNEFGEGPMKLADKGVYQQACQELLKQNFVSVNYRYKAKDEVPKVKWNELSLSRVDMPSLAGEIKCYEYQACEDDGWKDSKAFKIIQALKDLIVRSIAGDCYGVEEGKVPGVMGKMASIEDIRSGNIKGKQVSLMDMMAAGR